MFPFKDVGAKKWFYEAVKYVYENELMNGTTADKFEPNTKMTRAMFVTILGRLHGAKPYESGAFSDVKKNSWYSGYVCWASDNDIITGFPDNTFRPNESLTREQMATAMTRYVQYLGISPVKDPTAPVTFTDNKKIANWAKEFVNYMKTYGLVKGDNAGNFNPKGTLTRAEAATIVQRLHEMINYLRIEEPITPDYKAENGDFQLISAWDLYYSGTAVTTSYNGTKVTKGDVPTLAGDADGRKPLHFYEVPDNGVKSPTYMAVDLQILGFTIPSTNPDQFIPINDIKLYKYGHVVIGYKANVDYDPTYAFNNLDVSSNVEFSDEEGFEGYRRAYFDFQTPILGGFYDFGTDRYILSLELGDVDKDIEIAYIAMFKSEEEAKNFKLSDYTDELSTYDGVEIDFTEMDSMVYEEYMDLIDTKRDEIINNTNDIDPAPILARGNKVYYVSSVNGNDANDGLSPEKPWRTLSKLYDVKAGGLVIYSVAKAGDAVLFERGSEFNKFTKQNPDDISYFDFYPGVTYGAYGEGEKPLFTANIPTATPAGKWVATDTPNVWKLDQSIADYRDVGFILFMGEKNDGWGVKITVPDATNPYSGAVTSDCGMVTNNLEVFHSGGIPFSGLSDMKHNLEFFHNEVEGALYVYYENGNPGEVFDEVKILPDTNVVGGETEGNLKSDYPTVLDNLAVKYGGRHGITAGKHYKLTVQNCVVEWIGGSGGDGRLGNAIECWCDCDEFYVLNCYINQIYDAGLTAQGGGRMVNIEFSGNVIERCNMNVEFFNGSDEGHVFENVFVKNNYERYAGYGFGHHRPVGNMTGTFFLGSKSWNTPTKNMVVEGNINMSSPLFALNTTGIARGEHAEGIIFRNNTYFMNTKTGYLARSYNNIIDLTGDSKTFYPYTPQFIQYFADLGIERGSKFYYYTEPVSPMENEGVFH